jgi:hypothetical protein
MGDTAPGSYCVLPAGTGFLNRILEKSMKLTNDEKNSDLKGMKCLLSPT